MLGMMMDFLRDSIDPVFAKGMLTIYNSTTSAIMGIAAAVAIVQLLQDDKRSENVKKDEEQKGGASLKRLAGELLLAVAIIFFCYGEYCKLHYYEVPNINFYDSYEKVESEITAPGSIADVMYDEAANQREQEDAEESNGGFKVYGINYAPGSLIYHRMGEEVDIILYVTWDKGRKPRTKAEKLDFGGDLENPELCAENKIQITANPFSYFSTAKYPDGSSYKERYTYHDVEEHKVVVSLLDAEKQKVVQIKVGDLSDTITFEELQPGLYYYTVEADGYEPYVPGYAFEVTEEGVLDGRENFYVVVNETNEKPMSEEFRVQVWAEDEHPMPQTKVWAYIEYPNELEEESKWGYEMVTDENGFLFFKSDLTDKTVPVVREFQLQEGCRMMLDYEDAPRDTTVAVEVKNGIGIARLTER